jgi:NADP-dependent 3-hydroxy acid dehydrogenase YdfG
MSAVRRSRGTRSTQACASAGSDGSSRGLGRQIAKATLAAGHRLVATARRPDSLADLADRYGSQILPLPRDVTDAQRNPLAAARG